MAINALRKATLLSSLALGSINLPGCFVTTARNSELKVIGPPSADGKRVTVPYKKDVEGFAQAPFKYGNLTLGLKGVLSGETGQVAKFHSSYATVQNDYATNPNNKYWQGVVDLSPSFFFDPEANHNYSNAYAGLRPYIDFGQFYLGSEYPANHSTQLMMRLQRNSWDVTTAGEYQFNITAKNYFLFGVNLFSYSDANKATTFGIGYGLDRLTYTVENRVYREINVVDGKNGWELTDIENHGAGTGWNHRFFLDYTYFEYLTPPDSPNHLEISVPLSLELGINAGKLSENGGGWSSPRIGFFANVLIGFQFSFFSQKMITYNCAEMEMSPDNSACDK